MLRAAAPTRSSVRWIPGRHVDALSTRAFRAVANSVSSRLADSSMARSSRRQAGSDAPSFAAGSGDRTRRCEPTARAGQRRPCAILSTQSEWSCWDVTPTGHLGQIDCQPRTNGSAGRAGRAHGEPHADCPKVTWRSWSPGTGRARRLRPSPSGHGLGGRLSPTSASSRGLARIRCRAGPAR